MQRIAYVSTAPTDLISGGLKTAFRHVEVLNEAGLAAVFATPHGQPPTWLATTAPCVRFDELTPDDVLVFEECNGVALRHFSSWPNEKMVFCQNQFYVHQGLAGAADYRVFGVSRLIAPSHAVAEYCRRRFPTMPIGYVPYSVDPAIFTSPRQKRLQIAYVPRKRPQEAAFIKDLFQAQYPDLATIPWVAIANMPEREVARVLGDSALYLSLLHMESFGLTTLEALASGCIAVGFTGIGGDEFATSGNGFWVPEGDALACVDQLAQAAMLARDGGTAFQEKVRDAVATARRYGPDRFAARLVDFWEGVLAPVPPLVKTGAGARLPVRWVGAQFSHASLSLVNRELGRSLMATGEVAIEAISPRRRDFDPSRDPRYRDYVRSLVALDGPPAVTVRHQWPPDFKPPAEGAWVMIQPWEFGGLPEDWIAPLRDQVDEYWVPTQWVKDCAVQSGVPADQVTVVPNGVDTAFYTPEGPRYPLKTDKGFKFLYVGGLLARKGIDVAINAYLRAFSADDDVCLVVKGFGLTTHYEGAGDHIADQLRELVKAYPAVPAIEFIEEDIPAEGMANLYRAADALVHPYRGEGFGLPIAEAMASALPVLVTGYGACLDFCDEETAYLIPATVVPLSNDRAETRSPAGRWWAEPDQAALTDLMRRVVAEPEVARAMGERARARIVASFRWEHAAAIALARLNALAGTLPLRLRKPAEAETLG